jgi:hypothetical protein
MIMGLTESQRISYDADPSRFVGNQQVHSGGIGVTEQSQMLTAREDPCVRQSFGEHRIAQKLPTAEGREEI